MNIGLVAHDAEEKIDAEFLPLHTVGYSVSIIYMQQKPPVYWSRM